MKISESSLIVGMVLALMLCCASLSGCSTSEGVKVVTGEPDVKALVAPPPDRAMVPPHDPIPLVKGDTKLGNIEIMKKNNLACVDDRNKLIVLQDYVKSIFNNTSNDNEEKDGN